MMETAEINITALGLHRIHTQWKVHAFEKRTEWKWVNIGWFCLLIRAPLKKKCYIFTQKGHIDLIVLYHRLFNRLCLYRLHPADLPQVVTAVSGKLILAKYVHSENEKEEEEPVFLFFFFFCWSLKTGWKKRGGDFVPKIAVTVMPGKWNNTVLCVIWR